MKTYFKYGRTGEKIWYKNNDTFIACYHRIEGPAVEYSGFNEYWIDDVKYYNFLDYIKGIIKYKKENNE